MSYEVAYKTKTIIVAQSTVWF